MGTTRLGRIVVERHEMPHPGQAFLDPANVVLAKQRLLLLRSSRVRSGVAPAIEEIPALLPTPAGVAGSLLGGGAVVDDPDLVKAGGAEDNLIEVGIVGDRVHVQEVGANVALLSAGRDVAQGFEAGQFRGVDLGGFAVP